MERSKGQLLELVRCSLWGRELDMSLFEGGVDWVELMTIAKEQTLVGVVSGAIERLPAELRPRRDMVLKMHQMVTLNRQYRSHHVEVAGELMKMLQSLGVERPVLLKGLGVGLNYPDPSLRQCGDIDIYIGDRHYDKVWAYVCREFGIDSEEGQSHSDCHCEFTLMGTHIEVHRYVTAPSSIAYRSEEFIAWSQQQLEGDELRQIEIDGVELYLPPYNFDFVYIFYHTWRHFLTGGVGLRQICDWCCYIERFSDKFDREEVARVLRRFKLERAVSLFATVAVEYLGVDSAKIPGYIATDRATAQRVIDRVWSGGNFGFYRQGRLGVNKMVLQRKWRTFRAILSDMCFMMTIDPAYSFSFYLNSITRKLVVAFKFFGELRKPL